MQGKAAGKKMSMYEAYRERVRMDGGGHWLLRHQQHFPRAERPSKHAAACSQGSLDLPYADPEMLGDLLMTTRIPLLYACSSRSNGSLT